MNPLDGLNIGIGLVAVVLLLGSGACADAAIRKFRDRHGLRAAFLPWGAAAILLFVAALCMAYWALAIALP